jgi:hypothetical protein
VRSYEKKITKEKKDWGYSPSDTVCLEAKSLSSKVSTGQLKN